jgi:hypothetical protein
MKKWKIIAFVFIALFAVVIVVGACLIIERHLQIIQLEDEKATLTDQIENPETGYKKQMDELTADVENLNDQIAANPPQRIATSEEVLAFLDSDHTEDNTYSSPYSSAYRARDLAINAHQQGFKVWMAIVLVKGGRSIDIDVFETSEGLIYVDSFMDKPVTVRIGEDYFEQNEWPEQSYDGTVLDVVTNATVD